MEKQITTGSGQGDENILFMIEECNKFVLDSHKQAVASVYTPMVRNNVGEIVSVDNTSTVDFWLQF